MALSVDGAVQFPEDIPMMSTAMKIRRRRLVEALLAIERDDFSANEWLLFVHRIAQFVTDSNSLPDYERRQFSPSETSKE